MHPRRSPRLIGLGGVLPLGASLLLASPAADAMPSSQDEGTMRIDRTQINALNRVVMKFDFEESTEYPYDMPPRFYRILSGALPENTEGEPNPPGFLPFGAMNPANDHAASGQWSFRFSLDSTSLAARISTGVCPILPLSDYIVSARVRTEGLTHARAGIRAWLHDDEGMPIASSRGTSELVQSDGTWTDLSVVVQGIDARAVDLVVELHLSQPEQFDVASREAGVPMFNDVTGTAWFDDVVIRNRPRITLTSDEPGNVHVAENPPSMVVNVHDVTREHVEAHLTISDFNENVIWSQPIASLPNSTMQDVTLPLENFGSYHAHLQVFDDGDAIAERDIPFVWIDAPSGPSIRAAQFGVTLPDWAHHQPATLELLDQLGVGDVLLPLAADGSVDGPSGLGERILRAGHDLNFMFPSVPVDLARTHGIDPVDVIGFFAHHDASWKRAWANDVVDLGLDVRRWQFGAAETPLDQYVADEDFIAVDDRLSESVPDLIMMLPREIDSDLDTTASMIEPHLTIPYTLRPRSIDAALADWPPSSQRRTVTLETLPADRFAPRARVGDLARRALHTWRAGVDVIRIDAPWTRDRAGDAISTSLFPVWRTIAHKLDGRTVMGELPMPVGAHAWVLSPDRQGTSAMVIWDNRLNRSAPLVLSASVATDAVRHVDLFGNETTLRPMGGVHRMPVGDLPAFIEGIDAALVLFRANLTLDEPFIPSETRVHQRMIRVHNPWPMAITGSISLDEAPGLDIRPRHQTFTIPPGQTASLPVEMLTDRSILSGRRAMTLVAEIVADDDYSLRIPLALEVGLKRLECHATWRLAMNQTTNMEDLIVSVRVTNHGETPTNLDVFTASAETGRDHQIIAGLSPQLTTLRTFRFPNGRQFLSGKRMLVGVAERDGAARLNLALEIPPLIPRTASVTSP